MHTSSSSHGVFTSCSSNQQTICLNFAGSWSRTSLFNLLLFAQLEHINFMVCHVITCAPGANLIIIFSSMYNCSSCMLEAPLKSQPKVVCRWSKSPEGRKKIKFISLISQPAFHGSIWHQSPSERVWMCCPVLWSECTALLGVRELESLTATMPVWLTEEVLGRITVFTSIN